MRFSIRHASLNTALLATVLSIAALQFGLLPVLVHPSGGAVAVLFVGVSALTAPAHYGLMHETMHGHLYGNEQTDRRIGRLLGVLLGLPWETMRFGHLAHHSLNRHSFDRPEALRPDQSWSAAAAVYYAKLVIGHAVSYAVMPLPVLLPVSTTEWVLKAMGTRPETEQLRAVALRTFTNSKRRAAIRFDIVAIFMLFGLAVWLWGVLWPVFAASIAARWSVLSLLDNAPHYGMPLDSGLDARNTRLHALARLFVMNGNFHGVHHRAPQLCWYELPQAFARAGVKPEGSWLAALARQFRGPVRLEGA
jgi:fatty acid desaturase